MSDPSYVASGDLTSEYFGAEMRAPLLRRIAEETGGRFYTPDKVADLAKDIVFTDVGNTVVDRKDLWDMPIIFLLLLGARDERVGLPEAARAGVMAGAASRWPGRSRVRRRVAVGALGVPTASGDMLAQARRARVLDRQRRGRGAAATPTRSSSRQRR